MRWAICFPDSLLSEQGKLIPCGIAVTTTSPIIAEAMDRGQEWFGKPEVLPIEDFTIGADK